jgi:hypothetical protein
MIRSFRRAGDQNRLETGAPHATLGLALALALLVTSTANGQVAPLALESSSGSGYDIWSVSASDGVASKALEGVHFLPIDLVGYPVRDRLRLDLPTAHGKGSVAPFVRRPSGGSLFRVGLTGSTALLSIGQDGLPSVPVLVPDGSGSETALLECLTVRADGRTVLLATNPAAGGDVGLVDLESAAPTQWLTAGLPPLKIAADSLRVSPVAAWFVADGVLYRADLASGTPAEAVDLQVSSAAKVLPELLMCAGGHRVAVVVEDDGDLLQIVVVPLQGPPIPVTTEPDDYDTPNDRHPLGPFMAFSDDGSLLAYRRTLDTLELFLSPLETAGPTAPALHLTAEPAFPAYIDNVGVLGFTDHVLSFFAGDATISGVDLEEMIGAGDLFHATLMPDGGVEFDNVTASGGGTAPPYSEAGTLQFSDANFDPLGQRYVLVGESPAEDSTITVIDAQAGAYGGPPSTVLDGLDDDPLLIAAGHAVLILTGTGEEEASDDDSGKPATLYLLHSKHMGGSPLAALAKVPAGVTVDRFAVSPDGGRVACVVGAGTGLELPLLIELPVGLLVTLWPDPVGVAPLLAFCPSGSLVMGLGTAGGPYKFGLVDPGWQGVAVKLPVAQGFPLPR